MPKYSDFANLYIISICNFLINFIFLIQKKSMACSKYEYVKKFEVVESAMLQTYIVVRIDGRGFTKFCANHEFQKPNDLRAIKLMNSAAQFVCQNFKEIILAYGQSDEYSFAFNKSTTLFSRRSDKILSCVVSAFSSAYVFNWSKYFDSPLKEIPMFDSRVVVYPNEKCLKDYFRWRQVDCHINNLYNTVFWLMIKSGKSNTEVENILKNTNSAQKNEIMFSQFGLNYNKVDDIYKRGTFLCFIYQKFENVELNEEKKEKIQLKQEQKHEQNLLKEQKQEKKLKVYPKKQKLQRKLAMIHEDCIKEEFWIKIFAEK